MSNPRVPQTSRFGRSPHRGPLSATTFFDRHYRSLHHLGVVLGISIFFGPLIYKYLNRPSVDKAVFSGGAPRVNFEELQKKLDAQWK